MFFSLALVYRLRLIKLEKERADQKHILQLRENERLISDKVRERTEEINEQKKIIETKNEALSAANRILESQTETLTQQAEEIRRMNEVLNRENVALQTDVEDLTKARVMLSEVDYEEFRRIFPDENSCYRYLAELKWKGGYRCIRCENDKYAPGQGHYARRCSKCRYNESCTVGTLFYRCRIPVLKAFYMLFLVYAHKGQITSQKLSEILELRQNTCWKFSRKIMEKMKAGNIESSGRAGGGNGWSRLILD